MSRIEEFEEARPLLFSLAHRILGDDDRARAAVEETRLRHEAATTPPTPARTRDYLAAEATGICAAALRRARPHRDTRPGPRPPAPPPDGPGPDPLRPPELAATLSAAAVLHLERLSPRERAALALNEILGGGPARVAAAVGPAAAPPPDHGDGRTGLPWPERVEGADHVARVLAAIVPALRGAGVTLRPQDVDGGPGVVFHDRDGAALGAMALDVADGRVHTIRWITGPDHTDRPRPADPRHADVRPGDDGDGEVA
ncbi:MAG TPA: hypothetical protein VFP69_04065 [Streptomyces sp.]|nr:hypothetical protein [Streptomyces sp.]